MPGLLFTLEQGFSKIGILINKLHNVLFNFLFLKISSCLMMYFCCRQRRLKCRDLKREQLHLLEQSSGTEDVTGIPFTFCLG